MNNRQRWQLGFTVVEGLVILFFLAVISFVGYKVLLQETKPTASNTVSRQEKTPAITDKQQLSEAVNDLKQVDTDTKSDETSLRQLAR